MPKKSASAVESLPLRDACIVAAREVIAERGVEALSLRDVARRLGVSHQAPYKHYPSRDHLLAEVMRRCFETFANDLDARDQFDDPRADLESLGRRYLAYAAAHPLEYRLMFGTPWPEAAEHPALVRDAVHAFDVLRRVMRRMHGGHSSRFDLADLDALYIWSSMHGVASVMHGSAVDRLGLKAPVRHRAVEHVMQRVGQGLSLPA